MNNSRHGMAKTRLYHIWSQMVQRCTNPNSTGYTKYGAKGVTVCSEWLDPYKFMGWALLNGYRENLTIERLNVYSNYEPGNCTWVPSADQGVNKRKQANNTSGYVGVSFHKGTGKWVARVVVGGKRKQLGRYESALLAHEARKQFFVDNNLHEQLKAYALQHTN